MNTASTVWRSSWRLLLPFCVIAITFLGSTAQAQSKEDLHASDQDRVEQLELQLRQLIEQEFEILLWVDMQAAGHHIEHVSRCWSYLEMAAGVREELKALNARYKDRPDNTYREMHQSLVRKNQDLRDEYRSCFASVVRARYPEIELAGLQDYDQFVARYDQLQERYGAASNEDALAWVRREQEGVIQALSRIYVGTDRIVGRVTSVFKDVKVVSQGKAVQAVAGMRVYLGQEIITGARGRVRIELADRCERKNAGPTVVNVGSRSHIKVERFLPHPCKGPATLLDLINGTIRAAFKEFSRGLGGEAAFFVRVGTSLCGIRGTEVAINYSRSTDTAEFFLHHGSASLSTGSSGRVAMLPNQKVVVSNGKQTSSNFSPEDYASRVLATSTDPQMTRSQAVVLARQSEGTLTNALTDTSGTKPQDTEIIKPQPGAKSIPNQDPSWVSSQFPNPGRRPKSGTRLGGAHLAFERLLNVSARNDLAAMLEVTKGPYHEGLTNAINANGLEKMKRLGWRPTSWTVDCAFCETDNLCHFLARVSTKDLSSGERNVMHRIYTVERQSYDWYTTQDLWQFEGLDTYYQHVEACIWQ